VHILTLLTRVFPIHSAQLSLGRLPTEKEACLPKAAEERRVRMSADEPPSCPRTKYNTTKRSTFHKAGCDVFGWPSGGGMLRKSADAVELEHLGLARSQESTRSQDPAEEDAFCRKMRELGARWWEDEERYFDVLLGQLQITAEEAVRLEVGWPAVGGVWVLKFRSGRACPREIGRIRMARDMEERCRVIESLGGTFYADPEDCPDLAGSSQDTASEL